MPKAGYTIPTSADVALSAATAKSVLGVLAPAQFGADLVHVSYGIDVATVLLVELCAATFATNAPGTNSTTETITQAYGRSITTGFTAARAWTTEPTVLTPIHVVKFAAGAGVVYDFPLAMGYDNDVSKGFVLRLTSTAGSNARATFRVERC